MRKITILLSALLIAFTSVFAENVAKIGDQEYGTLAEAIAAVAEGDVITVQESFALTETVVLDADPAYTIDLNGKTVSIADVNWLFRLNDKGNVTIQNGTLETNMYAVRANAGQIQLKNLVINSTLRAVQITAGAFVSIDEDCVFTVSGDDPATLIIGTEEGKNPRLDVAGKIIAQSGKGAIEGNAHPDYKGLPIVNVLGGADLSSQSGIAVYQPAQTTMTISGGTITGATAVYVKGGTVNIGGGTIIANGAKTAYEARMDYATATGDALVIDNCNYPGPAPVIDIQRGSFQSANAAAVASYVGNGVPEEEKVVNFIKEGTFKGAVTMSASLLKEGLAFDVDPVSGDVVVVPQTLTLDPQVLDFGEINIINGENKIHSATDGAKIVLGHLTGDPEVEFVGEAGKFSAALNEAKDSVLVTYSTSEPGDFSAKIRVHIGEIDDTLKVSLKANELTPSIEVSPTEWKPAFLVLQQGVAEVESGEIVITGENLFGDTTITIEGGDASAFAWDADKKKVKFHAEAAGKFQDSLVIVSSGVVKKVALEVEVKPTPVIEAIPAEWKTTVTMAGGSVEAIKDFEIEVQDPLDDVLNGSIQLLGSKFSWNNKKQIVKFQATEAGLYQDTLVLTATKAEVVKVPLEVKVNAELIPQITVSPDKWEVTLNLEVNKEVKAEQPVVIEALQLINPLNVSIQGGDDSKFKWDAANQKVTFSSKAAGVFEDTLVVSSEGAETKKVALKAVVNTPGPQLSVKPAEWKTSVELVNGEAKAERSISINGIYLISWPEAAIKEADSKFAWNDEESKVVFAATEVGTYKATLVVSAEGAESIEVALEVEVTAPVAPVAVTGVTLDKEAAELKIGETLTLVATVAPANADNKAVTWSSDKPEIASVANGVVTAVAEGVAVITVKTVDGNFTAACTITVKKDEPGPQPVGGKDVIDYAATGMTGATGAYADFAIKNTTSGAEYIINAYDKNTVTCLQLRTNNNTSGFVTTKSAGKLASVTIKFNTKTTAERKVNIYATNNAFASPADLYNTDLAHVAQLVYAVGSEEQTYTFTGDFQFIGVRSADGALYLDTIEVVWAGSEPVVPVAVTGVTLNQATAEVEIGQTVILTAAVAPANATNKNVTWSSSNEAVAAVANGVVTAKAEGSAVITVKTEDGNFTATCAVTVTKAAPVAVIGVTLDKPTAEVKVGKTITLVATVAPANATNKNVSWSSDKPEIATVANGVVTGVAEGSAVITVKSEDGGFTASCTVTVAEAGPGPQPGGNVDVIDYAASGMSGATGAYSDFAITNTASGAEYALNAYDGTGVSYIQLRTNNNTAGLVSTKSAGSIKSVTIKFNAKTAEARKVNIYASNEAFTSPADLYDTNLAYVAQIAFADGAEQTYTFTEEYQFVGVRSESGALYLDAIEVTWAGGQPVEPVAVTGVTLNQTTGEVEIGQTLTLIATIAPANATNKKVTWSSDNEAIATVANGVVTGVAEGSANITVKTEDGEFTASCAVTVNKAVPVAVIGVSLDKATGEVEIGKTMTLVATIAPANASNKAVTWSSDKPEIATVANGVVTGVAEGSAVITVKTDDGGFTASCTVTVKKSETPPGPQPGGDADVIDFAATGLVKDESGVVYADVAFAMPSGAEYKLNAAQGKLEGEYIQIRSKNNNSGLVMTKSAGTVTSITIKFNEKTNAARKLNIYGSNNAFASPTDLYEAELAYIVQLAFADGAEQTYTFEDGYEFIGVRSADGALYLDAIEVNYGSVTPVDPVAVTGVALDKATAEVEVGKTIKLTATIAPANATNKKVTWSSDNEAIATVANGVVTGVAEGAAVITVKTEDGDFTATCAVTIKKSETPPGPQPGELTFTKVTEAPADWSGQYLIVCDDKSVVFNGLDAVNNGVAATIADNKVTVDNYAEYVVTIAQMEGGYSVQIGGQYIGGKLASGAAANGIEFSATPILNTITLANGVTNVESNGSTIRFNGKDDQLRFRYFKNSSLETNTDLVQVSLYKANGSVGPTPVWVPDTISVVEAIEACKDSKTHYVDGIIKSISTTPEDIERYGNLNFMLGDIDNPDVEISCFRLYWKTADGKFVGGEVAVGDTVRVFGTTNIYTKGEQSTNQISNGYIVEKLSGGEPVPPTPVFEINFVEAGYVDYEGEQYWQIFAGKLPENDDAEDYDYPHLLLYVDNTNATHIAGTFELFEGSFIVLAEGDTTFFVSGEIAVKCLQAATVKEDAYYSFIVTAIDEAGEEHVYEFKADVIAYDIMKSTEEETAWIDLEDQAGDEAIENINADAVSAKKVIKNGTIYIIRDGKMYNITGAVVE